MHHITTEIEKPTLQQKTSCALFISCHGATFSGIKTKAILMWPAKQFTDTQAQKEASSLLGEIHQSLLNQLPQHEIEKIGKRQAERLSFDL